GYFSVFSLTVAAGRPQVNYGKPNPSLGNELNSTPLISSNLKMILGDYKFYLSGTYVDLKVRQPLIDTNRDNLYLYYDVGTSDLSNTFLQSYRIGGDGPTKVKSGGYSFGMEIPFKSLEFKGEMYMGQNLGNLAMSSPSNIQSTTVKEAISNSELGAYTTTDPWLNTYKNNSQPIYKPIKEVGAWGSVNYKINESYQVGIHGGAMKVLNPEDIVPASSSTYLLSQVDTTSAYWNVNSKVGGVRENSTMGYRLAYLPEPNLTFFFQHDYLQTFYKNTDREKGYFSYIDSIQWETGVITLKPINYSYLKSGGKASSHMVRLGVALSF
ncbi:MAG: hypothetical protein KDK36_08815, partial [Leptospiraceae bacterium]|nr:hypothetical protein [Leptospiraceae bacterium]